MRCDVMKVREREGAHSWWGKSQPVDLKPTSEAGGFSSLRLCRWSGRLFQFVRLDHEAPGELAACMYGGEVKCEGGKERGEVVVKGEPL